MTTQAEGDLDLYVLTGADGCGRRCHRRVLYDGDARATSSGTLAASPQPNRPVLHAGELLTAAWDGDWIGSVSSVE